MEINNWNKVPDGAHVIEDTYNEVYEIFTKESERWLRQVGWQIGGHPVPNNYERLIDWDPQPYMDQPWYRIK